MPPRLTRTLHFPRLLPWRAADTREPNNSLLTNQFHIGPKQSVYPACPGDGPMP